MKNLKDIKITTENWDNYATVKTTTQSYCESCSKKFGHAQTVFYAWLDGTTICRACTTAHAEVEIRLFIQN